MKRLTVLSAFVLTALLFVGASAQDRPQPDESAEPTEQPEGTIILSELPLDRPQTAGGVSLEQTLAASSAVKNFTSARLSLNQLGQLGWAGQGLIDEENGIRTAPSAGNLHPVNLYFAVPGSLYTYNPDAHSLEKLASADIRRKLADAAGPDLLAEAPCDIIVTGSVKQMADKFGKDAWKLTILEAGQAVQNIRLQSLALGLGASQVAAFDADKVSTACELPEGRQPLCILAVGYPTGGSPLQQAAQLQQQPRTQPVQQTRPRPRVLLVVLANTFQPDQFYNIQNVLSVADFEVVITGTEPGPIRSMSGERIQPAITLNQVSVADYDAFVFFTAGTSRDTLNQPGAMALTRDALNAGKVVGAVGRTVRMLAGAGVLQGVAVTGAMTDRRDLLRAGAIFLPAPVQRDRLIVTGRGGETATLFARAIINTVTQLRSAPQQQPVFPPRGF